MLRNELNNIKLEEKMILYKRLVRIDAYEREQNLDKMNEKLRKFEDYRDQKAQLVQKKKEVQDEIIKQKKEVMEKFEKLIAKSKGITVSNIYSLHRIY